MPTRRWRAIAQPYGAAAPLYDVLSGERPIYRPGREAGIKALRLRPGDTVLDVGCGTGLSFPLLSDAVGPTGHVVGVDASPQMLALARRRAGKLKSRFTLLHADASDAPEPVWEVVEQDRPDAVLFVYSLSLMDPWRQAYENATARASGGARVCVVDMAVPTGRASLLSPLARLACWLGGADIEAHPWRAVEESCSDVEHRRLRGGHIRVVTATAARGLPGPPGASPAAGPALADQRGRAAGSLPSPVDQPAGPAAGAAACSAAARRDARRRPRA